jgi:hypothetical protein
MNPLDRRANVCRRSLFGAGERVFALLERQAEEIVEDGAMDLVGAAVAARDDDAIEVAGGEALCWGPTGAALHVCLRLTVAMPSTRS